jgi:hypothetical protein
VRNCQTPVLHQPDDVPPHPYGVAIEAAMLAPKVEASMFPWKEPKEPIPLAVRQILSFLGHIVQLLLERWYPYETAAAASSAKLLSHLWRCRRANAGVPDRWITRLSKVRPTGRGDIGHFSIGIRPGQVSDVQVVQRIEKFGSVNGTDNWLLGRRVEGTSGLWQES